MMAIMVVVLCSLMLIQRHTYQYEVSAYVPLEKFSLPKLWGRESYSPDWRHGDNLDITASEEFFATRSHGLTEIPNVNIADDTVVDRSSVAVVPVPHWQEISPFRDTADFRTERHYTNKFVALGESEPFAFAIRSVASRARLKISLEDWRLNGEPNAGLDASIRLMLPYRAREKAGKKPVPSIIKPMVLVANRDDTWTFDKNYTLVVVSDVHASIDSVPGMYTTNLVLRNQTKMLQKIPISIEVLPFKLKVNQFHAGAFGIAWDLWEGGFSGYYPEMVEMDSRYGFNLAGGFFNKGNEIPFQMTHSGALVVNESDPRFDKFNKRMRSLAQHGMGEVLFWNWGGSGKYFQFKNVLTGAGINEPFETNEGKKLFAKLLRAIKDAETRHGWPEIVVNPYDEALKDQDATREIIKAVPFVRKISPKTRLYMTEWREGYTRHYQSSGFQLKGTKRPRQSEYKALRASGEVARLNFAVIGSNIFDDKSRSIQNRLGGEYWHYTGVSSLSAASQFAMGFRAWIGQAETVLIWANYKGTLNNDGWTVHYVLPRDENGRKNRNTRGPVIASARAYVVREGIDDRKYLETLRYYAWRENSEETWKYLHALSKRASNLLSNKQSIGGLDNTEGVLSATGNLYALRAEIKDKILQLLD